MNQQLSRNYSFFIRPFDCRLGIIVYTTVLLLMLSPYSFASERNIAEFRRMFVPLEKIGTLAVEPSLPIARQWFENIIEHLKQRTEQQSETQPYVSHIFLRAKLEGRQLVEGEGVFSLHPRALNNDSVPLNPLKLAVHSLAWNSLIWAEDREAFFFHDQTFGNRLLIPEDAELFLIEQLQFQWTLQSRNGYRNGIVFDFELPPCLQIELQIELPVSQTLSSTAGLVMPGIIDPDAEWRTWHILLGHHSTATIVISEDKTLSPAKTKSAFHQRITHAITPQGLESQTRIIFDSIDDRPNELIIELEMPLRPIEVRYGEQTAPWTRSTASPDKTEVRIDLSSFPDDEHSELSVRSLGPLLEEERWTLPRIRVTSPDILWLETRCGVSIYAPLRSKNVIPHQAAQVPVLAGTFVDWSERELYVFQFFQDDAQIEVEVIHPEPQIILNSAVQIHWRDNEIRGTVYLDCNIPEGERFTLNFPVSDYWIIDSVTSYPPSISMAETDTVFSWNVLPNEQDQSSPTLSVQLNAPLRPQRNLVLQISCRFINSSQRQFRLLDLSPFVLSRRNVEQHYIASLLDLTFYSLKTSRNESDFYSPSAIAFGGQTLPLLGDIYPLNSNTQNIRFDLERTRSNYTADISGNIYVDHDGLIPTFRIRYTPIDSSISRTFIHFTPVGGDNNATINWEWSLSGDTEPFSTLRVQKISPDELKALFPVSEQTDWIEFIHHGDIWEIRFDEIFSTPFELSASAFIPLDDSIKIPMPAILRASAQRGEINIISPQRFDYKIINTRLDSIPITLSAWNQYQDVRAAFRYDPITELRMSQHSPLSLQRLSPDELVDTAWIWSLRLHSYHEPKGLVRYRALLLVENQGNDTLEIKLPDEISSTDISTVWRNSQRIPWRYNQEQNSIEIDLLARQRFVSILLEYTYQNIPLVKQRKLHPHYPSADIPILAKNWTSWFPPEFDVSLRRTAVEYGQNDSEGFIISQALEYLLSGTYRSYLWSQWDKTFNSKRRRSEAETASQYFFEELVNVIQNDQRTTYGGFLGSEKLLSSVKRRLSDDTKKSVSAIETKLLVDKEALTLLGIAPAASIEHIDQITPQNIRDVLFERSGLVLLVAANARNDGMMEYIFAITTPLMLSFDRQIQPIPAGHRVFAVPLAFFEFDSTASPNWLPAQRWIQETTLTPIPWPLSEQFIQSTVLTSEWNAYELPINVEQSLYIVHRQNILAWQWLAFLFVVLLTCRKPFASPILLVGLLILFEIIARSVAHCYVGIPSGAFLGVLVSIGFILIRSQNSAKKTTLDCLLKKGSTECSISFVQTPLFVRHILICGLLAALSSPVIAQNVAEMPSKEPYRVFYPIDSDGQIINSDVWLPREFFRILSQSNEMPHAATSQRWHLTKAVYQGSFVRGTSGHLESADDFKAVYDVYLDSSNVMITLPDLPYVPGRIFWNTVPIQTILTEESENGKMTFQIENETPGKHTLEIGLSLHNVLRSDGETFQIDFPIPKVPNSRLHITVPPETPVINVHGAVGSKIPSNILSPNVIAELGLIDNLSLSWRGTPSQNEDSTREVEQFLWIRARPSQVELELLYRFRIEGRLQSLSIQTDPRWFRPGQFRCDEHPIVAQSMTMVESPSLDNPHSISHIEFQSPVSGTITIRADFMLRGFNGIGNIRLPEFRALNSRVTRSMLGVSADSSLELVLPIAGRTSGFEAGWHRTPTIAAPLFGHNPIWDMARELSERREAIARDRPEIAYDLSQTELDWILNIRAKHLQPDVDVYQSVQIDNIESRIHAVGEFTSTTNVFQQQFSIDRPIQIESIEVRNNQNEIIESRYQKIVSDKMLEQYRIVFNNHVTGKYTVVVRGLFETNINEPERIVDVLPQAIPKLTFDDVQTMSHVISLFRTPAVIAEVVSENGQWTMSHAMQTAPDSFIQPISIGTWQQTEFNASIPNGEKTENNTLRFVAYPNRPKVQSKTVLSLYEDAGGRWNMTVAFNGNVTDGELRSLAFHWDERCGLIQSILPSTDFVIDRIAGQQVLTLLPADAMQGVIQFQFNVALNTTGTAISLPNVFPMEQGIYQMESEIFVELPSRIGNEDLNWERSMLEEVVLDAVDLDDVLLNLLEGFFSDTLQSRYRVVDTNFSATLNQAESRLTALFYDIGFLVKRDGTLLGNVMVDLRNQGQDHIVIQMPSGYEPIQIFSAGSILGYTWLEGSGRLRINIGKSDYPQRLNMLFHVPKKLPLRFWNQKQVMSALQFPVLEGVVVQDTIWTVAFEGSVPSLRVESILDEGGINNMGEHTPLSGAEASLSLVGLNLVREHNLLRVLNSIPSGRPDEMLRWFSHWTAEWNTVAGKVDFQVMNLPLMIQNVRPSLIVCNDDYFNTQSETVGIVRPFLETISATTREALRARKKQSVNEKFGNAIDHLATYPVSILNSQVYWQGRISGETRYLFGAEERVVQTILLTSNPNEGEWTNWLYSFMILWISFCLLCPIFILMLVRCVCIVDMWYQFPHFWGMSLGIILWTFVPESFIGIIVILLTCLSFFRPSWPRHRTIAKVFQ